MSEVLQLSIAVETLAAEQRLRSLDTRLDGLNRVTALSTGRMTGMGLAATRLAQAMAGTEMSVVGLASSVSRLASVALGGFGIALSLGIAALVALDQNASKVAKEGMKAFEDATKAARDELEKLSDAVTFFGQDKQLIPFLLAEAAATGEVWDAQRKLDDLNVHFGPKMGPVIAATEALTLAQNRLTNATKQTLAARGLLAQLTDRELLALAPNVLAPDISGIRTPATLVELRRAAALAETGMTASDPRGTGALNRRRGDTEGIGILTGGASREIEDAQRNARRALHSLSDGIAEFVLSAEHSFGQLIDSVLNMMLRAATETLLTGVFKALKIPGFAEGGVVPGTGPQLAVVHGGETITPRGQVGPSITTQVTFQVQAMDAQSVATFFEQHGGRIAGIVGAKAARSVSLRRALHRG